MHTCNLRSTHGHVSHVTYHVHITFTHTYTQCSHLKVALHYCLLIMFAWVQQVLGCPMCRGLVSSHFLIVFAFTRPATVLSSELLWALAFLTGFTSPLALTHQQLSAVASLAKSISSESRLQRGLWSTKVLPPSIPSLTHTRMHTRRNLNVTYPPHTTYHTHIHTTPYTHSHTIHMLTWTPHVHTQTADLVNADASEEEKVLAMIKQAGEGFDPSQYVKLYSFVLLHVTLIVPWPALLTRSGTRNQWATDNGLFH